MITVEEAKGLIKNNFSSLNSEVLLIKNALGRVISENISSPIDMPPFRQSAMDGYAVCVNEASNSLVLQGEIKAGDTKVPELIPGHALRIFTGAMVPDNADIVVMQEKVRREGQQVYIEQKKLVVEQNIRPVGEQISKGELAVAKGTELTPGVIGFLASLGITEVRVIKEPRVALAITGDELVQPGNELPQGKVFESNSVTVQSAAKQTGYQIATTSFLRDDFKTTKSAITSLVETHDALILTGGISVGDYDFVWKSLQELGCETLFYKVKQKPGKPLFIGEIGSCSIFALPGNPYAALSCYYQYVLPALDLLSGKNIIGLTELNLPLAHDYSKKGDRAVFLKAQLHSNEVSILDAQASSMLSAFTDANAQVYIAWDVNELKRGDLVATFLIN